jgi:hypothetical protein
MRKRWSAYLKDAGEKMLKDEALIKKQFKIVEDILHFKKRQEDILSKVFIEKPDFEMFRICLREALEALLNINSN